jgi:hypothetical protein
MSRPDESDEERGARIAERLRLLATLALEDHPERDRALAMMDQGGDLFIRSIAGERFRAYVGWFNDPRSRPADADPAERVVLMTVSRAAIAGQPHAEDS